MGKSSYGAILYCNNSLLNLYCLLDLKDEKDIRDQVLKLGSEFFYRLREGTRCYLDRIETDEEKEDAISMEKKFQNFYSKINGKLLKSEKVGLEIEKLKDEWKDLKVILNDESDCEDDPWLNPKSLNFKELANVIAEDDRLKSKLKLEISETIGLHKQHGLIFHHTSVSSPYFTSNPCFNSVYKMFDFMDGKNNIPVKFMNSLNNKSDAIYFVVNAPEQKCDIKTICSYENAVKENNESFESSELPLIKYENSLGSVWKTIYETEKEQPVILSDARSVLNLIVKDKNKKPVTIEKYGKSLALKSDDLLYNKKDQPEAYLFNMHTLKKKLQPVNIFYTMKIDYFLQLESNVPNKSIENFVRQPRSLIHNYPDEVMNFKIGDDFTWDNNFLKSDLKNKKDLFDATSDTILDIYDKYNSYNDDDVKLKVSTDDNNQLQFKVEYW